MGIENEYMPSSVSPPGRTLQQTLEAVSMSQLDLARRTGRTPKNINEIIKGDAPITPEFAIQLERVLDTPANFWNNREMNYREFLATQKAEDQLKSNIEWLKNFPIRQMINFGWIEKREKKQDQLNVLLRFFGVSSPNEWNKIWGIHYKASFRITTAYETSHYAIAAWLRQGEIEAQRIECQPFDKSGFKSSLAEIRSLTYEPVDIFVQKLKTICAENGIAVVWIRELPKSGVSGATRWMSKDKAIIQLSLRYKSDDHLWFTFFHEAGHILLHGKKELFLEGDNIDENEKELEANDFSANLLIPPAKYKNFIQKRNFYKPDIIKFAKSIEIAPGIVVGRLQRNKLLSYKFCNHLKKRFQWK